MSEQLPTADNFARRNLPPENLWPDIINLDRFGYPERLNCVAALLDSAVAEGHGERLCLRSEDIGWSYAETQAQVNRIANFLVNELELLPGERVMLGGPNSPMLAACWLAVVKAGGIAVATMALLRSGELTTIAEKAQVRLALCDAGVADAYSAAADEASSLRIVVTFNGGDLNEAMEQQSPHFHPVDTAADDVCLIAFTSGTTGNPKGCIHFHRDIMTICATVGRDLLKVTPDDMVIGSPPLAFTFGLGGLLLFPLYARATAIMLEKPSPANLAEAIRSFKATVCFTAPTAYRAMLLEKDKYDFSSLRVTVSAGEALPKAIYDGWLDATGIRMVDGIGATELLHIFISAAGDEIRPGAIGRPLPSWEARIVDAHGKDLPDGEVGGLLVRGPVGCRYLDDPRQANYIVGGWNSTGDAFMRDADGYYWFQSRADDLIISSGYNIAAPEVEGALLRHAAVAETAVVGIPDVERGSVVKAFVVVTPGVSSDETLVASIQAHVKEIIAPYKYPRVIEFVDALPKTDTGKIQRYKLRDQ